MIRATGPKVATLATLVIAVAVVAAVAAQRGAPGSLLPHGYCFTWNPALLWTHVISDSLIGAAYVSIPLTLVHLLRQRKDIPFNWIVLLFAIFIVSCGATHWIEVWTVWHPDYWLSGNVKLITAAASVLTAVALIRLVPLILAIPTIAALTAAKQALEAEVATRSQAEQALLQEREHLERRVSQRTQALALATAAAESAHAAAEEANALKDRFLAKVSHELRTPLQSTLSWAQVLQHSGADPARAAHAAERIQHNVKSQARLIDDLLDISRILSGKLSLQLTTVDAFEVIRKAGDVVRSACATRNIDVEVCVEGAAAPMATDPVRLEQVVWNLMNNAVQASTDGGRVRVTARTLGSDLYLEVTDWGRGIDIADLPSIFEPFHQGLARENTHRGLGLGLAITRSIVESFGGELHGHSEGVGRGATFSLRLPMSAPCAGSAQDNDDWALTAAEHEQLRGLKVLYAEDDADIAEACRLMLTTLGAEVTVCSSFDEACDRIPTGGFDLLLSDLNLGHGRSALDLLAALRRSPHGYHVPALVLSAYGRNQDKQASLDAGFAAHMVKPVGIADLARTLLNALDRRPDDRGH